MSSPLYIAFIWHMHQPYYRDMATGDCSMPWVRLHGTKDYLDMVKLLDLFPNLHQTFNLVPSLLDQLEEYVDPANRSDRFLELSRKPAASLSETDKRLILEHFFMANLERMIKPYPRYHDLLAQRGSMVSDERAWPSLLKRFKTQDYLDLQVWFNLVWIDPWLRAQDPQLAGLEAKGSQFSETEKHCVLDKQLAILQRIVPAYLEAQRRGQVELTTSPYYHPIVPLLCDLRSAHIALPTLPLPEATFRHPEDARWHLIHALKRHEALFGQRPLGMWPPEGSVSEELVRLVIEEEVRWIATDEEILWRTVRTTRSPSLLYRPHLIRRGEGSLAMVFRDRELSDLIGFVYSQWNASIAIQDFLKRLETIAQQVHAEKSPALVSIILDGENAWESYPHDGHDFLQGLYHALANDHRFRLVTVSEFLNQFPVDRSPALPELFAGSWIDGNFATWIGHPEKNTAWTHLVKVRQDLEVASQSSAQAWRSFYIAEGSDWMWWLGDTHSSAQDEEFDRLFRLHLANVYRGLNQEVPDWLQAPIKTTIVQSVSEPSAMIHPTIDGLETSYFEWLYAGRIDLRRGSATMHRSTQLLRLFHYGFDRTHYYFRLDVDTAGLAALKSWRIQFEIPDHRVQLTVQGTGEEQRTSVCLSVLRTTARQTDTGPASPARRLLSPGRALRSPPAPRDSGRAGARAGGTSDRFGTEQTSGQSSRDVGQAGLSGLSPHQLTHAYRHILEVAVPKELLSLKPGDICHVRLSLYEGAELVEHHPTHGTFRVPIPSADFETMIWSV